MTEINSNTTVKIILAINAAIQNRDAKLLLDSKRVLCVALDSTCTFDDEEGTHTVLTDEQLLVRENAQ